MVLLKAFQKSSFLLLVFTILFLSACEAATRAAGSVKDKTGQQIAGVTVIMESNASEANGGFRKESEQKTMPDGTYNFVTITGAATQARLTFSKEGYKTQQLVIKANEANVVDVVLEADIK
jgi:hypothetical protein